MKRLLGAVIAAALVFPPGPASAEILRNLKVSGGLDIQSNSARNVFDFSTNRDENFNITGTTNNDRVGNAFSRIWVSGWWDLLDDVHAKVTLVKNNRAWGSASAVAVTGAGPNGGETLTAAGANNIGGGVAVREANVKIDKLMGTFDATLGRQFYGEMGDLVIYWGPRNNYGLGVTAIDALRVDHSNDWFNFTGIVGKGAGTGITGSGAGAQAVNNGGDNDIHGFDAGWKMLPIKVNTALWRRVIHAGGALGQPPAANAFAGTNDYLYVAHIKARGEAMGGWLSVDLAKNFGENRALPGGAGNEVCSPLPVAVAPHRCRALSANYTGYAFLLDAGYNMDVSNVGGFTPWLNFGYGSGRSDTTQRTNEGFTAIASDYRPGIIYGRFDGLTTLGAAGAVVGGLGGGLTGGGVSQAGLNNRVIWGVGLKYTPSAWNQLTAGLSFWDFRFQRATQDACAAAGSCAFERAGGNKHIGSEIDLQLDWKHSDNVMVSVGAAHFRPGSYIQTTIARDDNSAVVGGTAGVNPGAGFGSGGAHGSNPVAMAFADFKVRW